MIPISAILDGGHRGYWLDLSGGEGRYGRGAGRGGMGGGREGEVLRGGGGGGVLKSVHGRSRMAIDPRTPTRPGRSTGGGGHVKGGRTHFLLALVI